MIQVFTTGQVARITGASSRTVQVWFDTGLLRGYRLPGRGTDRRIPRDQLIRFLRVHGMPETPVVDFELAHASKRRARA